MRRWVSRGCLLWAIFCRVLDNPEMAAFPSQHPWKWGERPRRPDYLLQASLKSLETYLDPYPKTC